MPRLHEEEMEPHEDRADDTDNAEDDPEQQEWVISGENVDPFDVVAQLEKQRGTPINERKEVQSTRRTITLRDIGQRRTRSS